MSDVYSNTAEPGGGGGDGGVTADIVVTDRDLFDSAISDPEPQQRQQPEQRQQPPQQVQPSPQLQQPQQPDQGPQPRNAQGQFAPRQQPPQQQRQQPQQQRPQQQPQGGPGDQHHVPLRTYLDEREQRYRIQAEHDQMRRAWQDLHQAAAAQAQAQQQRQQPQTIYDDPVQYLHHNVMQPLRNEGHMAMLQIKDGLSREFANAQFGEQNVDAALQAMASIRHTPNGDHVFRQIMSSGHPYGQLVRWFNYARAQQAIGPDPQAWISKQREAWMNDPRVQAEVIKRATAAHQQQQQQQTRQRTGGPPNVQLPPSLSSLPAASGRGDGGGDLSDASLYAFATR